MTTWEYDTFLSYIEYLTLRESARGGALSDATRTTYMRHIKAFCTWLVKRKHVAVHPMADYRIVKAKRVDKAIIPAKTFAKLLRAARKGEAAVRDETILLLMLDVGLRASEVVGLDAKNVNFRAAQITVLGKGAKFRTLPVSEEVLKRMAYYSDDFRDPDCPTFFQAKGGRPLTYWGLREILRRTQNRAGIEHVHWHTFRHTFATMSAEAGMSPFILQAMLGHESMEVTRGYVQRRVDAMQQEHKKMSPLLNLDFDE